MDMHPAVLNMENQQGPAGQHRELCSVSRGSLDGGESGGEGIRVYVWLSCFTVHSKWSQHCLLAITQ